MLLNCVVSIVIKSRRSRPPTLTPWSVIVTFEFSPTVWKKAGPAGRYHIWSSGLVQSVPGSKILSVTPESRPGPLGAGVLGPKTDDEPVGYGKLPVVMSNGVAEMGIAGVAVRSEPDN